MKNTALQQKTKKLVDRGGSRKVRKEVNLKTEEKRG